MKLSDMKEMVITSTSEVLERMAFIDVEIQQPYSAREFVIEKEILGSIAFQGKLDGRLIINCSQQFAREATLNLLGLQENEVTEEQIEDNIKEITNIISGNIFCKINERERIAKLDIPEIHKSGNIFFISETDTDIMVFPFAYSNMSSEDEKDDIFLVEMELKAQIP